MVSPAYGPGFPGSLDLYPLHLNLLQSLDKYLLSITMCQAFPRGQKNYSEHNFLPLSTPKMLLLSKVLSISRILHSLPEPSLYLCGFIFFNPHADDSQRPGFSLPYLFS